MSSTNTTLWKTLEYWSPALLYIAGTLSVLFTLQGVIGFELPFINSYGVPYLIGIIALSGVLGLYPTLSERAPQLSRAGSVFLVVAVLAYAVAFFVDLTAKLSQDTSLIPGFFLSQTFIIAHIVSVAAGYLLFGIAALSTTSYLRLLGFILLVPAGLAIIEATVVATQSFEFFSWFSFTGLSIDALAHLAMGYILSKQNKAADANLSSLWS